MTRLSAELRSLPGNSIHAQQNERCLSSRAFVPDYTRGIEKMKLETHSSSTDRVHRGQFRRHRYISSAWKWRSRERVKKKKETVEPRVRKSDWHKAKRETESRFLPSRGKSRRNGRIRACESGFRIAREEQAGRNTLPSRVSRVSGMRGVRFCSGTRHHQSFSSFISEHYSTIRSNVELSRIRISASRDKQPAVETVAGVLDSPWHGVLSAGARIDRPP